MEIEGVAIGPDHDPFFIAEAGVNHNGSLDKAKDLIDVAAGAGADAVKFQTFSTDRLVTRETSTSPYQQESTGEDDQYEMLKRYELDRADHRSLLKYCSDRSITFLSTPFDPQSAEMLEELGISAIKIGSGELDNHPLLAHVAKIGLPMIVSTGMGTLDEVTAAYEVIHDANPSVDSVFLHCTSSYPASLEDVNLRAMQTMDQGLPVAVGYSDHTTVTTVPALATAAGASVLEKHFTLDRSLPGPDHETSLEPNELSETIELVEMATTVRGAPEKQPVDAELDNRAIARKSIHAAVDIPSGTTLTDSHLEILRPADGISPREYEVVIGSETIDAIKEGDPILQSSIATVGN